MLGLLEIEGGRESERHEESSRNEEEEFRSHETLGPVGERPEDRERMLRVDVELRPLVPLLDVFHREVVEVQLLLEGRDLVRVRVDGVDPEPLALCEIRHGAAELIGGYRIRSKGSVADDVGLHPRERTGADERTGRAGRTEPEGNRPAAQASLARARTERETDEGATEDHLDPPGSGPTRG